MGLRETAAGMRAKRGEMHTSSRMVLKSLFLVTKMQSKLEFRYLPCFLSPSVADALFVELQDFQQYKSGTRWRAAMADDVSLLLHGGGADTMPPADWLPETKNLRNRLQECFGVPLNYMLVNHYVSRQDCIKYHSDSEINSDSHIVSISLGAERDFLVYRLESNTETAHSLRHGDLLLMQGAFNRRHMHAIRHATQKAMHDRWGGHRINLTFRFVHKHRVNPPPTKAFSSRVGHSDAKHTGCLIAFTPVVPKDTKRGDIKWKRWGSIASYEVLVDISSIKRACNRKNNHLFFNAPDFYLRSNLSYDATQILLQRLQNLARKTFPRGRMFLPVCLSIHQFCNMIHECM